MTPTRFFVGGYHFTDTWDDYFILVIIAVAVALGYLFTRGNVGIYVLLNALAIGASAVAMHFPPFRDEDAGPVSLATAEGE